MAARADSRITPQDDAVHVRVSGCILAVVACERLLQTLGHLADGQAVRPRPEAHGPITREDGDRPACRLLEEPAGSENLAVLAGRSGASGTVWEDLQRDPRAHLDRAVGRLVQNRVEGGENLVGAAP